MGTSGPASHSKQLPPRPPATPCPKPPASGGFQKGFRGTSGSTTRASSPLHLLPALAKRASARPADEGQHEFAGGCGQAHGTTRPPARIRSAARGTQAEQEAGQTQAGGALAMPRASAITTCCPHTHTGGNSPASTPASSEPPHTWQSTKEQQAGARHGLQASCARAGPASAPGTASAAGGLHLQLLGDVTAPQPKP